MTDLRTVKPENLRYTKAPLSMEQIQEYYLNKDIVFVLDYAASELKGKMLMSYLANMDIPAELSVSREIPLEDRIALVREYMSVRSVVRLNGLNYTAACILMQAKGFTDLTKTIVAPILNEDEINYFIHLNGEIVSRWVEIMDSMITFNMSAHAMFVEAFGNPKTKVTNIDDALYVGVNFVNLFTIEPFMHEFYTVPGPQRYFVKQFEEYMFKGNNLFSYFITPQNPLPALMHLLGTTQGYTLGQLNAQLDQEEALRKTEV